MTSHRSRKASRRSRKVSHQSRKVSRRSRKVSHRSRKVSRRSRKVSRRSRKREYKFHPSVKDIDDLQFILKRIHDLLIKYISSGEMDIAKFRYLIKMMSMTRDIRDHGMFSSSVSQSSFIDFLKNLKTKKGNPVFLDSGLVFEQMRVFPNLVEEIMKKPDSQGKRNDQIKLIKNAVAFATEIEQILNKVKYVESK